MSTDNLTPKRQPAYSPPLHADHLDAKYPYYYGYSLLKRDDRWEIWHYASDRLVHVETDRGAAMLWASRNPAIPRTGNISSTGSCWMAERYWRQLDHV